jgi:8-oxo-dGTP pyrophosphatase MutT (NUDIX family)
MRFKIFSLVLLLCFTNVYSLESFNVPLPVEAQTILERNEVKSSLDNFGNLKIELDQPSQIEGSFFQNLLPPLISIVKEKWVNRGVFVHIPLEISQPTKALKTLGFELYSLGYKKDEVVYLFRNGRNIPSVSNGYSSAGVFMVRITPDNKKELLVLSEFDKSELTIPGGCTEDVELLSETAVRECMEEVGIRIDPNNLRVMQVKCSKIPVIGKNSFGLYFYTEVPYDTEVKIDNKEVINYKWVPEDQIKNPDFVFDGKKFARVYHAVLMAEKTSLCLEKQGENNEAMSVSVF